MIKGLKGGENVMKFFLLLSGILGLYLIVAWASYSPLDNGWAVASSATQGVLNKAGRIGAWLIDLLYAMFGKVMFLLPFGVAFSSVYLLVMRRTHTLSWKQIALWFFSFLLLLCGLAGFAGVFLTHSANYLSGGFMGGLLETFVGGRFGQFGTLLVAMIFTAVGFYFCSGQRLIDLSSRFYQWITDSREPKAEAQTEVMQEVTPLQAVEPSPMFTENAPLVEETADDAETAVPTPEQLTDVSVFTRPKITGLRTQTTPQAASSPPISAIAEMSPFNLDNEVELPKIRVPDQPTTAVESMPTFRPADEPTDNSPIMPKVRLNNDIPSALEPSYSQPVDALPEISLTPPETAEMPSGQVSSPYFVLPTKKPAIGEAIDDSVKEVEPKPMAYPKGYGETFIHPLLRQPTHTEKPTTPLPTLDLLTENASPPQQMSEQEIRETSAKIERELANFGVKATVEDVLVGPVVTRYEIQPAAGVKASKITGLGSDLARALIFDAIRITEAVPGKPYIGIEAPNRQRETVWLRDVLDSHVFRNSKATLPMALGKNISGDPVVVDMAKMPHLLVAGQTGGGKSVGVNAMILSLLYKLTPNDVRFIMIDPKVVELSVYNDIPHLLTPVVTDMKKAENALRWAVEEMERRYLLLSGVNVRNIEGYNNLIQQAEEMGIPIPNPVWKRGDTMDQMPPPLEKMTYIVLVVDEFADLMMSAGKQVEDHIMRIAQKARAVGIHLILATQRPSTDVITGVIKANIPSRIAFTVASQIDSRTILDKGGAESLLGRGDMLYAPNGSPEMIRIHGAFMTDEEVNRVADNWRARGKPAYIENITASADDDENGETRGSMELDPLFDEIAQFMIDGGATSISGIQRRFSVGFNRAARIIDQLEAEGILSPADSRGRREVLAR